MNFALLQICCSCSTQWNYIFLAGENYYMLCSSVATTLHRMIRVEFLNSISKEAKASVIFFPFFLLPWYILLLSRNMSDCLSGSTLLDEIQFGSQLIDSVEWRVKGKWNRGWWCGSAYNTCREKKDWIKRGQQAPSKKANPRIHIWESCSQNSMDFPPCRIQNDVQFIGKC